MDSYVNVIIPTYKDWDLLKLCLDGLMKQTYSHNLISILVVNNDPEDTFNNRFEIAENVTVLDEHKPGSYAARNKALQYANGKFLGFTDSDCIPDPDWIKNAVEIFESDSTIDRIGGKIKMFYPNEKISLGDLYEETFAFPQEDYANGGFAVTGNLFVRKEIFDTVGLFDDNLMSGGDAKWGLLATEKGFNIIYSDKVVVNHPTRSSIKELKVKMKRVGKGLRHLHNNRKKPKFLYQIYYYGRFEFPRFLVEAKKRNSNLKGLQIYQVALLRCYLLFIRDQEKYK